MCTAMSLLHSSPEEPVFPLAGEEAILAAAGVLGIIKKSASEML